MADYVPPVYIYKRNGKGFKAGDLKQSQIDEENKRMEITRAAATLFSTFDDKMKAMGRYDFNDMIVWVLRAFQEQPALLLSYQERHQFILVDEFQDTNGAQNELLKQLTEFWDDPNIFVVGDDDQSIYEFQGARIRNIIEFYERYKEKIRIVVLPQNYRSSQLILDKATAAIENNQQRLIYQLQDLNLNKNIIAAHPRFLTDEDIVHPVVKAYPNILHEEADIVMQIEALQEKGLPLKDVAVIYAQHKQADNLIALMERKGIPYCVKKPVNILELPLIQQIINVLRYLNAEKQQPFSGEAFLFEMLHAPYYGIKPTDIALLSIYMQQNKQKDRALGYWRLTLGNFLLLESLQMESSKAMSRMGQNADTWLQQQAEVPLPMLIEKIMYESGMMHYVSRTRDHVWNIQVLHSFFSFVRDVFDRTPRVRIPEFLGMIDRMLDEKISLPVQKVVQNENGVHLYTAHG
ncbi:MAG: ATP-dependent helicase, partial [Sphingobacteriales bacterium]